MSDSHRWLVVTSWWPLDLSTNLDPFLSWIMKARAVFSTGVTEFFLAFLNSFNLWVDDHDTRKQSTTLGRVWKSCNRINVTHTKIHGNKNRNGKPRSRGSFAHQRFCLLLASDTTLAWRDGMGSFLKAGKAGDSSEREGMAFAQDKLKSVI